MDGGRDQHLGNVTMC